MLTAQIEALLFISHKPLSLHKLAELTGTEEEDVKKALSLLRLRYQEKTSGLHLVEIGKKYQLMTKGEVREIVERFTKDELTADFTRPQLETLTIICYRGPLTKRELEKIRGVNCSLVLRNLLMRGLVETVEEKGSPEVKYQVTMEFLRFLGVDSPHQLPDYQELSEHQYIKDVLKEED